MPPIRRCPVCATDLRDTSNPHCSSPRCRWSTCGCGTVVSVDHMWIAPTAPRPRF